MKINTPFLLSLILGLWMLLSSCQKAEVPQGQRIQVQRVISGQSLEILDRVNKVPMIKKVRLIGINTPDLRQEPWGVQAKTRLEQLIKEKPVLLEFDVETQDSYNQVLGYIWQDGILINEQMIREGYAMASIPNRSGKTQTLNTKYQQRLIYSQEWARQMEKGIWNPRQPLRQTAQEFRDQQEKAGKGNR
jgi:micrococcal nuclease